MRQKKDFYINSAIELAPKLLGKLLCRKINQQIIKLRIIETEAYYGESDTACHAHKGRTNRTEVMYEEGGIAYVYLCYGVHYLLNVVTGSKNFPEAVLIRSIEGFNGPGRTTQHLKIDKSLNNLDLVHSNEIWIEDDGEKPRYKADKRVGIDYATKVYRDKKWRFVKC